VHQALIHIVDNILIGKNDTDLPARLKAAFGLSNVTYDNDFAYVLTNGIGNWQSLNWDPAMSDDEFYNYCGNITSSDVLYPTTEPERPEVTNLVDEGGYEGNSTLVTHMLNMIGYFNLTEVQRCAGKSKTQDQCFGDSHNQTHNDLTNIHDASWKAWPYQYCTEWGYLQTGNVPEGQLPLVSRTSDIDYLSLVCKLAFNRTEPADVEVINKYGGYDISYPRLAFVDGDWDPWKPATPHA
jgi:hypothetical protein